jgi:glycosyltransferase involved in cell wall biosynthesis
MSHKLGVIVPYRLRKVHLDIFVDKITEHLNNQNIDFEIIVVNQDNAKQFNRGMLLNIGYLYAKKLKCDYLVFHDVDMIPSDVDYS